MAISLKGYENRYRAMADRQGWTLTKSRRFDPRAKLFDTWGLWDPDHDRWALSRGTRGWGLSLDEVIAFLTTGRAPDDATLVL